MEKCEKCGHKKSECTCKPANMKDYTPADVISAFQELQETVKKADLKTITSAEFKERMEKINTVLDSDEFKKNQKLVTEHAEKLKVLDEQAEQIEALELQLSRMGTGKGSEIILHDSAEYKAIENYVRFGKTDDRFDGDNRKTLQDLKTLRSDIDPAGGYLTDTEFDNQIIRKITEISPIRNIARVRTISKKSIEMPTRQSIPIVTNEGETKAGTPDASTYGSESLTPFRLTCAVPYTQDLLLTSEFDLESEINIDVSEAYAQKMGRDYTIGTGPGDKMSEGFLQNSDVQANFRETEDAGEVSSNDMTLLTGDLKVGYNPMYGFNRQTLAKLRTLKDDAGNPIWQLRMSDNAPNQINGEPYTVIQDMPSIAAGALPVVYADFMRGYSIVDRSATVIIRDEVTLSLQAMIQLVFHRWTFGQVTLSEAFRVLKVKSL